MAPESSLSEATRVALNKSQVIDLTTTGRRTGQRRRIEIFLHNDHGQLFITGMPGLTVLVTGSTTSKPTPTSLFT